MEKITCNIVYKEGNVETKAKFNFMLTKTTPIIENPVKKTAVVVVEGNTFETDLDYKTLLEKQNNCHE